MSKRIDKINIGCRFVYRDVTHTVVYYNKVYVYCKITGSYMLQRYEYNFIIDILNSNKSTLLTERSRSEKEIADSKGLGNNIDTNFNDAEHLRSQLDCLYSKYLRNKEQVKKFNSYIKYDEKRMQLLNDSINSNNKILESYKKEEIRYRDQFIDFAKDNFDYSDEELKKLEQGTIHLFELREPNIRKEKDY